MFKNLDSSDVSIQAFKAHKNFTFTNNDSGSGVYLVKARSGSQYNYISSSDAITTVDTYNFFGLPTWHMINQSYYIDHATSSYSPTETIRELNTSASVISVAREVFGEEIKPGTLDLSLTIGSTSFTIKDDEDGNLYDNAHSASFAAYKSSSFDRGQGVAANGSGSDVGNIFYNRGLIVLTDTGSYTNDLSEFTLKYKSTQTIYEHEYRVTAKPNEFNTSTNISLTADRSGSITIFNGAVSASNFFPPSHLPTGQGTGSYNSTYNAATESLSLVTGSEFSPFVTNVGLYDQFGQLLAHAKMAKPIKLSKEIDTTFVVRFDI
jgi:hypothetical protein|tara:strand:- start:131 stop:1093 length:963 start_codon:yes stop_codon:yes gene_type:complete